MTDPREPMISARGVELSRLLERFRIDELDRRLEHVRRVVEDRLTESERPGGARADAQRYRRAP